MYCNEITARNTRCRNPKGHCPHHGTQRAGAKNNIHTKPMFPEVSLVPLTYSTPQVPKSKPLSSPAADVSPAITPEKSAGPRIFWVFLAFLSASAARAANLPDPIGAFSIFLLIASPFAISVLALRQCNSKNADGVSRCRNKRPGVLVRCQHESHRGFNLFDAIGVSAFVLGVGMLAWAVSLLAE